MTALELYAECRKLAPDFEAGWEYHVTYGKIYRASCTLNGRKVELSQVASKHQAADIHVLRTCRDQLARYVQRPKP